MIVLILLVFAAVFLAAVFALLTVLVVLMERSKMKLYSLFLEIPSKYLKSLSLQAENFLNELDNKGEGSKGNDNIEEQEASSDSSDYLLRSLFF